MTKLTKNHASWSVYNTSYIFDDFITELVTLRADYFLLYIIDACITCNTILHTSSRLCTSDLLKCSFNETTTLTKRSSACRHFLNDWHELVSKCSREHIPVV